MYILEEQIDFDLELPKGFVFDIETTGLSPKYNRVVMISYAYQENGYWILRQEMAQEKRDESLLLLNFSKISSLFLYTVHYNGLSFDLPFINSRLESLALAEAFDKRRGFDLYRYLKKKGNKGSLRLSVQEKKAGFYRQDILSGKDWVDLFYRYEKDGLKKQRDALFLHNKEDVLGTLAILKKEKGFQKIIQQRLHRDSLVIDAYPGKDELRLLLYDGKINSLDLPALSFENLLFSPDYSNDWSPEEKRKALLAYDKKCFYENIKRELLKIE